MNIQKLFNDLQNQFAKSQKVLEERTINRHENNVYGIKSLNEKIDIEEEGLCEVAGITSDETDASTELAEMVAELYEAVAELGEIVASKEV